MKTYIEKSNAIVGSIHTTEQVHFNRSDGLVSVFYSMQHAYKARRRRQVTQARPGGLKQLPVVTTMEYRNSSGNSTPSRDQSVGGV